MSAFHDDILSQLADFEKALNLPTGFVTSLEKESDWSFIIKGHALLEASVNHLLIKVFSDHDLEHWLSNLPLNGRSGRITLLKNVVELERHDLDFVAGLSQLRNTIVHDIKYTNFKLHDYLSSLSPDRKLELERKLSFATTDEDGSKDLQPIQTNPRGAIWTSLKFFLAVLYLESEYSEAIHQQREAKIKHSELSFQNWQLKNAILETLGKS